MNQKLKEVYKRDFSTNIDLLRKLMQKTPLAIFCLKIFKNRKNLNQTFRGGFIAPTTIVQFPAGFLRQVKRKINKFFPNFILINGKVVSIMYRNRMVQGRGQLHRNNDCVEVME